MKKSPQTSHNNETTHSPLSQMANVFHHLSLEAKAAYFKDRYGTVKGTTWFFDYWYKQGIKDVKTFASEDGTIIDACITLGGGSYESWGGDSNNAIIVYMGDDCYHSGSVKYSEKSNWRENYEGRKDYKELLACTYDPTQDNCVVQIKNWHANTITLTLEKSSKIERDEQLIGKLYIPAAVLERQTQAALAETLAETAPEKSRDKPAMYQKIFDMHVDNAHRDEAFNLLNGGKINVGRQNYKGALQVLSNYWSSNGYWTADYFPGHAKLLWFDVTKHTSYKALMKQMALKLIDYLLLSKRGCYEDSIKKYMALVDIAQVDKCIYSQKLFDAHYASFDLEDIKIRTCIDEKICINVPEENNQKNYELLYTTYIAKWGLWDKVVNYNFDYVKKTHELLTTFFRQHGIASPDLFPDTYTIKPESNIHYCVQKINQMIELNMITLATAKKAMSEVIIIDIVTKLFKDETDKGLAAVMGNAHILNTLFGVAYTDAYVSKVSSCLNNACDTKKIPDILSLCYDYGFRDELLEIALKENHFKVLVAFYEAKFLSSRKHLRSFAMLAFRNGQMKLAQELIDKGNYSPIEKKLIKAPVFADSQIQETDDDEKRIPYISIDKAQYMIGKYLDPNSKSLPSYNEEYRRERVSKHLGFLFAREDITAEYINTLAKGFYETEQWESLYFILKSGSIKLDKTEIDLRIQDLITQWKVDLADKISCFAGLNAVRAKDIAREKIKSGTLGAYNIEDAIETHKLDNSYYKYAIDARLTSNDLQEALACSEKHSILITPQQLEKYEEMLKTKKQQR